MFNIFSLARRYTSHICYQKSCQACRCVRSVVVNLSGHHGVVLNAIWRSGIVEFWRPVVKSFLKFKFKELLKSKLVKVSFFYKLRTLCLLLHGYRTS